MSHHLECDQPSHRPSASRSGALRPARRGRGRRDRHVDQRASSHPSVLVYVERAGATYKVSGTSNGGTRRASICAARVRRPPRVQNCARRPRACGRRRSRRRRSDKLTRARATCTQYPTATRAPTARLPGQARDVPALPRYRRRRRPNNGVPYDFRYWAPQLHGRSVGQSVSNWGLTGASRSRPTPSAARAQGVPARRLRRRRRGGPRGLFVDVSTRPPRSARRRRSPPRRTRSACSRSQTSVSTDLSTGNILIRETENMLRCSPDPEHDARPRRILLVVRLGRRPARPRGRAAGDGR